MRSVINLRSSLFRIQLLLMLPLFALSSFSQTTFQYLYDEAVDEMVVGMTNTLDGGYATIGFASFPTTTTDIVLAKYNALGQASWQYRFTGPGNNVDQGTALVQLPDSGYACVGITFSYNSTDGDIIVFRTDKNGTLIWSRVYDGGTFYDYGYGICKTLDGGLAFAGLVSTATNNTDVFISKVDLNGNPQWTSYVGGTGQDHGYDIVCTSDSGFIVGGSTTSYGPGNPAAGVSNNYLVKVDKNGALVYTQAFGRSTHFESILSLDGTSSGGVAYCGNAHATGGGPSASTAGAAGPTGTLLWNSVFSGDGSDEARSIVETFDNGFVLTGTSSSTQFNDPSPSTNAYLIRLNNNGSLRWARSFGQSSNAEMAHEIFEAPDSGFVAAGAHFDFFASDMHVYLFKTDTAGRTTCNDLVATPSVQSLTLLSTSGGSRTAGTSGASALTSRITGNWTRLDLCTVLSEGEIELKADPVIGQEVQLTWTNSTNSPLSEVVIERSFDGIEFLPIANSDQQKSGSEYLDTTPKQGSNYYRVIGIDREGELLHSNTVEVILDPANAAQLKCWPNPFQDVLQVKFYIEDAEPVEIRVNDLQGRLIDSINMEGLIGWNETTWENNQLPNGYYLLTIKGKYSGKDLGRNRLLKAD